MTRVHPLPAIGLIAMSTALAACAAAPEFSGPMSVRNQHPAQLTVLHMTPQSTRSVPVGEAELRWDNAYTSLWLQGSRQGDVLDLDGESWVTTLALRTGLLEGLDLGIELPFLYYSSGFVDSFIIDWHDWFGFPQHQRDEFPEDQFNVVASRGGRTAFQVEEDRFGIGDVPLTLQYALQEPSEESPFGFALRGAVELPSGNEKAGFGNGKTDWSLGALAEYRYGSAAFTGHAQYTFAGTPSRVRRAGLSFHDVPSVGGGVEWALERGWALLAQTEWEASTLRRMRVNEANDSQWLLWAGVRKRFANGLVLDLGLGEDLSTNVAPDISFWIGLRWR